MRNRSFDAKLPSPCWHCEDRKVGCHSRCRRYKEYREKYDELNKKERDDKSYGSDIRLYIQAIKNYHSQSNKAVQTPKKILHKGGGEK